MMTRLDVNPPRHLGTQHAHDDVDRVLAAQWLGIIAADVAVLAFVVWAVYVIGREWGIWA
jgi:hypothetical protein